ncbi:MAG: sigma-70 family RNA polymerase sigma factor [Oscillospiraceae bacterium]|nr:sigma-70 family RNA polymerase sigma factor [Eubacteriales bacterium]MDY2618013.1 sigma-70 family RNA polymerase sigma factor [Oscillospiraceae bacterium]
MSAPAPELLSAAQAGDRAAEERMIVENSRLIWSVVRRYTGRGAEQEDLYQLGCIGFLKAIHGFDPDFGTQFSTYAVPKIAGEMRRFLRDDGTVKVSRTLRERSARIAQARTELSAALGREPVLSELAEYLTLEPEDIAMAETATASVTSLSAETGEGLTLESVLGDEGMEDALVEQLDLRAAIARLPERERTVIDLRYFRAFTQERTARVIGVSQVQVSRIERRAVERLRRMLES